MKVEQTPIDKIIPYVSNSRTHDDAQISQIAASIKEFGFNNPVLLDGDKGIIAGHGRVMAAKKLGLKTVPTIELKHLSENQRKAYIIADNKLALNAGWDMELLTLEMGDLQAEGFDLSLIGFGEMEIENLINPVGDDEADAWAGMPEFSQEDKTAFRSIVVHFKDQGDLKEFISITKSKISESTKMIWYPEIEIETAADKVYK